jgi:hypothetical protein
MSRLTLLLRDIAARGSRAGSSTEQPQPDALSPWLGECLPLIRPGFPITVCWSAKAGCTTVLKWFLAHNHLLEEALAYSSWVHDYREQRLCAGHDYLRQCVHTFDNLLPDPFIIKVIRSPASRAVSSFLHFLRNEHSSAWAAGATVNAWKQAAGLGHQRGLSFRQFLHFIADEQRLGHVIDIHFRPQYTPLQDTRVHAHLKLEKLAAGLAELEDMFHLRHVAVQGLSVSEHHNPPTAACTWPETPAALPADRHTLATYGTPSTDAFLDRDTRALIRGVYRIDYEAYPWAYPDLATTPAIYPSTISFPEAAVRDISPSPPARRVAA